MRRLALFFFAMLMSWNLVAQQDCGTGYFTYGGGTVDWQYILGTLDGLNDGQMMAFQDYINDWADPLLVSRLQNRFNLVYAKYVNTSSGIFDFPEGEDTCIEQIDHYAQKYSAFASPPALDDHWLFVVHASLDYESFLSIWEEVNAITTASDPGNSKTILISNGLKEEYATNLDLNFAKFWIDPDEGNDWAQRRPQYWEESPMGNHKVNFIGDEVTIIGGTFGTCHKAAMYDLVEAVDSSNPNYGNHQDIVMTLPMQAIALAGWFPSIPLLRDYMSLEDEYVRCVGDTWDFLDFYDSEMLPDSNSGDPDIFAGEDAYEGFHVKTQINGKTVDLRGGVPGALTTDRIITVNMTTPDGQEPALPDLNIRDFHIVDLYTVYFKVYNSGTLRFREPVDITYKITPVGVGWSEPWARGVISDFVGGVDDSIQIEWNCPHDGPWPPYLKVELSTERYFIESSSANNSRTIETGY